MKLESLEDLYLDQLRDLYSAENQLLKALPKMAKGASSAELRRALEDHLQETQLQAERLEQILAELGAKAKGKKCKAMEGLIEEGKEVLKADADEPAVQDAALIAAAQRVEHYEIAGYGCARTYARLLGQSAAASLLERSLEEEKAADEKLNTLAESSINLRAAQAGV